MIKRRSAIEPTIGQMKSDGRLGRNWLKGALGDAMHAVLCGTGHNLRIILRKLRLFWALLYVPSRGSSTQQSSIAVPQIQLDAETELFTIVSFSRMYIRLTLANMLTVITPCLPA